jgi:hypothetical protein
MHLRSVVLVLALAISAPAFAHAQDFGVMESAETIDRGNFKFKVNPVVLFGKDRDEELGVSFLMGYGFTNNFDLEGGVAVYDGIRIFGGNAEVWLIRNPPLDFSVSGGVHVRRGEQTVDMTGIDLTFLASKHVGPRVELYGALDLAFEEITENGIDHSFKTIHFVPGMEVKLGEDLDFVAELGLALNDEARHYFSGGLAYYFR